MTRMNKRRIVWITAGLLAGFVAIYSLDVYIQIAQAPKIDGLQFISALMAYTGDLKQQGKPVPAVVTLRDLVAGGYITPAETGIFSNLDVSFSTRADDTNPQAPLVWVKTPDGTYTTTMADGSVEQLSQAAMAATLSEQQSSNSSVESLTK